MTQQEVRLWLELKRLHAQGIHFRRQTPFRGYYLDFVCFGRRLVIEVDGAHHAEDVHAEHDAVRDAVLVCEGFHLLRFWNHDVDRDLDGVMLTIQSALAADSPTRPLRGLPSP